VTEIAKREIRIYIRSSSKGESLPVLFEPRSEVSFDFDGVFDRNRVVIEVSFNRSGLEDADEDKK